MTSKTTTSEVIDAVAAATGYPKNEVDRVLQALTAVVTNSLHDGKSVAMNRLGVFKPSHRAARPGRNPSTGETIQIAASNGASFSAAKALKEALNT